MIYDTNNNRSLSRGHRQFIEPRKSRVFLSNFLPKLLFSLLIVALSTTVVLIGEWWPLLTKSQSNPWLFDIGSSSPSTQAPQSKSELCFHQRVDTVPTDGAICWCKDCWIASAIEIFFALRFDVICYNIPHNFFFFLRKYTSIKEMLFLLIKS